MKNFFIHPGGTRRLFGGPPPPLQTTLKGLGAVEGYIKEGQEFRKGGQGV